MTEKPEDTGKGGVNDRRYIQTTSCAFISALLIGTGLPIVDELSYTTVAIITHFIN